MLRGIGAVIGSIVLWFVVATVIHRLMFLVWPAYAVATPLLAFTLPMKIFRLALSTVCTLLSGAVAQRISPARWVPVALGCVLVLLFLPEHIHIWSRFPVWYHLTFLVSLIPLAIIGAHLANPTLTNSTERITVQKNDFAA